MKAITSKEYIKIERFQPVKYIEIYRGVHKIYTYKTNDTTMTLDDLKRRVRHDTKIHRNGERFKRLAVKDGYGHYYSLAYRNYYFNMADEYAMMKILKKQLENESACAIYVETATTKTEYLKEFSIVYVN